MRIYRALLHLYPASFRNEYSAEMEAIFARRQRDARGPIARASLWMRAIGEVAANAAALHADILRQDVRYGMRALRRTPSFTLTAVAILAIGIGANTAAFSVTDFVLLRPLPYPEPDRLVKLWERTPGYPQVTLSPENYRDWKRLSTSFTSMSALWTIASNLSMPGADPERVVGAAVTWDVFQTLGVSPRMGRSFSEPDDREGAAGTVILSDSLWRSLFGAEPDVLGKTVTLDDLRYQVIGIMSPDFAFPSRQVEFWRPIQLSPDDKDRTNTYLTVIGRLKPGVTLTDAAAEMNGISSRLAAQFPDQDKDLGATILPMRDDVPRQSRFLVLVLSGAAACILLIVCANLANLLLTRALGRRREIAVRAAIGAGRERIVRQLATESAMLGVVGGIAGVALAYLVLPALAALAPVTLPTAGTPDVDTRVLLVAAALTAITVFSFGVAPALRLGRDANAAGLREGARGGTRGERLRSIFVVAELAASIVLLVGTGLLIQALWTVSRVDPGFNPDHVLTARTTLPWPKYGPVEKRAQFYTTVLSRVRALPGVTSAGYISGLPFVVRGALWSISLHGQPEGLADSRSVSLRYVTPGFFTTLGIPIARGRDVRDTDGANSPFVAIVSESLARREWPGQDPIGQKFTVAFFERTIVGVVRDVRMRGLEAAAEPQVYIPYRQITDFWMSTYAPKDLAIRISVPPTQVVSAVRQIVKDADPTEPVSDVRMLSDIVALETAPREEQLRVLGAFAFIAALLAAIGIHGLLAFGVSQRVQEFGVRMAVGAQPSQVAGLVMRQGVRLALAGIVPGVLFAYLAARSLRALLAGVSPADPLTFAAVVGLVLVMTLVGSLLPAWRALRVNPLMALRSDN
jgi:putative ABC transport system permease protein